MNDKEIPDFGPFAADIFEELFTELQSRLTQGLQTYPEADRIAIITAISKAGWQGILTGIAIHAHEVNQKQEDVEFDTWIYPDDVPDLWAQRYGEGGGTGVAQ